MTLDACKINKKIANIIWAKSSKKHWNFYLKCNNSFPMYVCTYVVVWKPRSVHPKN